MTDLKQLRAALADDERTPAGIDVATIRTRARRTRRRAVVAVSVAVVAVLAAVVVPISRLDSHPVPVAAAASVTMRCPQTPPSDRDAQVPTFPARQLLLCDYRSAVAAPQIQATGRTRPALAGATVVADAEVAAVVQRQLRVNARAAEGRPCARVLSPPVTIWFAAADGRTASITTQRTGCGFLSAEAPANLASTPAAVSCPAMAAVPGGGPAPIMMPFPRVGLLLCRYEGGPDDLRAQLVAAAVLTGKPASALVERANALPTGVPSCPASNLVAQVAIIAIGPDGGFPLAVADLRCPTLSNGTRIAGLGGLGPELDRLTGP